MPLFTLFTLVIIKLIVFSIFYVLFILPVIKVSAFSTFLYIVHIDSISQTLSVTSTLLYIVYIVCNEDFTIFYLSLHRLQGLLLRYQYFLLYFTQYARLIMATFVEAILQPSSTLFTFLVAKCSVSPAFLGAHFTNYCIPYIAIYCYP